VEANKGWEGKQTEDEEGLKVLPIPIQDSVFDLKASVHSSFEMRRKKNK
jgi:hypothetical protein